MVRGFDRIWFYWFECITSAIANELRTMLQEKIVKEEMIFIQPHIKLMCDLLAVIWTYITQTSMHPKLTRNSKKHLNIQERNKKDMFDPVVGQIMRIYGYFVMKKLGSQKHLVLAFFLCFEHNWVLWLPVGRTWIASHAANWVIDVSIGSQTNSTKDFGGYPEILRRRQTKLVIKNRHLTW